MLSANCFSYRFVSSLVLSHVCIPSFQTPSAEMITLWEYLRRAVEKSSAQARKKEGQRSPFWGSRLAIPPYGTGPRRHMPANTSNPVQLHSPPPPPPQPVNSPSDSLAPGNKSSRQRRRQQNTHSSAEKIQTGASMSSSEGLTCGLLSHPATLASGQASLFQPVPAQHAATRLPQTTSDCLPPSSGQRGKAHSTSSWVECGLAVARAAYLDSSILDAAISLPSDPRGSASVLSALMEEFQVEELFDAPAPASAGGPPA
ncbi:hypothetical protein XENOCAPTIV_017418 [Xenoophorus captivus]|uniref:Uncharacterized protein n=1 Tax=Xenoophorus captivus TaxID=1517983 RepID=A0ABV0R290_9TELE